MRLLHVIAAVAALVAVADARMQKIELLSRLEEIAAEKARDHHAAQARRFGLQQLQNIPAGPPPGGAAPPGGSMPPDGSGAPTTGGSGGPSGGGGSSGPSRAGLSSDAPPQCLEGTPFAVAFEYVDDVCTRAFGKLDRVNTTNKTATQAGFDTFCKSACLSALNQLLGDEQFRDCLPKELAQVMEPMLGFCQKDASGKYCVLKFAEIAERPPAPADSCLTHTTASACKGTSGCSWNVNDKECEKTLTTSDMNALCDPCIITLAESSSALSALALSCHQVEGRYCAIELQKLNLDNPTQAELTSFCANSFAVPCVTQMLSKVSQTNIVAAQRTYFQCSQQVNNGNYTKCVGDYLRSVAGFQKLIAQVPDMCRKNAAGRLCYEDTMTGAFKQNCMIATVTAQATCDSTCGPTVQNISTTLGCCLGFINELFTPRAFSLDQVPGTWATTAHLPPARGILDMDGLGVNISLVATCPSYTAPVALTDACTGAAAAATAELHVALKLNWTYLAANDAIKRELQRSLIEDIAAELGAHPSAIIDASLRQNTTILLNAKSETGASFVFKIKASTQALTDHFLATFRAANNDALFSFTVLANTVAAVCDGKDGSLCVGPQGVSRVAIAANPTALALGDEVRRDPCYDRTFFTTVSRLMHTCASNDPFATPYTTQEASNATFTAVCTGDCAGGLRDLARGRFAQCLPQRMKLFSNYVAVACSTDSKTHFLCGTVMHKFDSVSCDDKKNATSCTGQCSWNANKSRCDTRPTTEFLASVCDGECVPRFTASLAGDEGEMGSEARFIDQAICAKDDDHFCIPAISDELNDEEFSLPTVTQLCTNGTKGRCFRRFQSAVSGLIYKSAEEAFFQCADAVQYDQIKVLEQCLTGYFITLIAAEKFDDLIKDMCLTKTGTTTLCLAYYDKYADDSCFDAAMKGNCQSSCTSTIQAGFDDMGCCAGTLQAIFGFPPFKDSDLIPDFSGPEGGLGDVEAPQSTTAAPLETLPPNFINETEEIAIAPSEGFLRDAYKCLNDASFKAVRRACKKDREQSSVSKELGMGIAFSVLSRDAKKKKRIELAARSDLANKLGVSKDDITSITLVEDSTFKIRIATTGRDFATQQTSESSGSKLTFSVHAQKATDTAHASKTFDTAKANNRLTLPATTGTVAKECSNCVAAGASASSVQSAAPATTLTGQVNTTAAPASSASTHALGSVLAMAFIAALLLF